MRQLKKNSGKYKKRFWVRKIYSDRKQKGEFNMLVKDFQLHDELFISLNIFIYHLSFLRNFKHGCHHIYRNKKQR